MNNILTIREIHLNIEQYLKELGRSFIIFDRRDSGCVCFGVESDGQKWFVKYSNKDEAISTMKNAVEMHKEITHPLVPPIRNHFLTPNGLALVYDWVEGQVLYSPEYWGEEGRSKVDSPFSRFRNLPEKQIVEALNRIFQVHAYIENRGYIAVDFYDGNIIYDFSKNKIHLIDLDHYTKGEFILDKDRLPGSTRFMAPEEFQKGSIIDQKTNVYNMGATAFVFLGGVMNHAFEYWLGSRELYNVVKRAVEFNKDKRYSSVREFYEQWLKAQSK